MTIEVVLFGALGVVILLLGVLAKYRGNRLEKLEQKFREAQFKYDSMKIEGEVRDLEKKSRESSKVADDALIDYVSRIPHSNIWRPGSDDPDGKN